MNAHRILVILGGSALIAGASLASAQVAMLGAAGDSLTDEYLEETYSYASNWTMQLVRYRGVNMGPTAAAAGQSGGTWGEPRRTGNRANWARYSADSATLLSQGQHTGLAAQVGPGGVSHAVLEIGTNDFSPSTSAYFNIYWGLWSQSQITSYVNGRIANITTAIDTLDATGVGLAVCNCVDFGVVPVSRQIFSNAARRDRVAAAVARVNEGIEDAVRLRGLVLVDINGLATAILGTNTSLRQFLTVGNVNIQLFNRDTASHTNPLAGFVDDGAHPHTSLQGVFANLMMTTLNLGWNAGYSMFSDQEILAHAGIAYGGAETLSGQIGPYEQYIRVYRCSSDFDNDGDTGTDADIEAFFACLGGSCCSTCNTSDFNGDRDFGTDADIESFFRVLSGGPC